MSESKVYSGNRIERWLVFMLWAGFIYVLLASLFFQPSWITPFGPVAAILLALIHPLAYFLIARTSLRHSPVPYTIADLIAAVGIYALTGGGDVNSRILVYFVLALWGARWSTLPALGWAVIIGLVFSGYLFVPVADSAPRSPVAVLSMVFSYVGVLLAINLLARTTSQLERQLSHEQRLLGEASLHTQELDALREIGQRLTTSLDLDAVLDVIVESALRLVHATDVQLFIYDARTGTLSYGVGAWGEGRRRVAADRTRSSGLSAQVIREKRPVVIADTQNEPAYQLREGSDAQTRSIAGFPIKKDERVLGVFNVSFDRLHEFTPNEVRALLAFADQAAIAIENARLYREAKTNLEDLARLYAVSAQLAARADPETIPNRVIEGIAQALHAPIATIALVNESTGNLEYAATIGVPEEAKSVPFRREGLGWTTLRSGEPRFIEDVKDASNISPMSRAWGYRAVACLPIQHGGTAMGLIYVNYSEPHTFTTTEKNILAVFANQTAIALENARLFEEARRQLHELSTFHALAVTVSTTTQLDLIIEQVCSVMGSELYPDNFGFMFVDEAARALYTHSSYRGLPGTLRVVIPIGQGITGMVAETGESILCKETGADPRFIGRDPRVMRSELCVPLKAGERIIGVINVESLRPNAFSDRDLRFLSTLASQIGTVIENARLFDDMQRRVRELTVLNQVAVEGARSQDVDALLSRVTEIVTDSLYHEDFGFLLLDDSVNALRVHPSYRGALPEMRSTVVVLGNGVSGWAAEQGEPVYVPDTQADPRYISANPGMRSELCAPLKAGDRVIGIVNAESAQPNAFGEQDLRFLTTLAGQVAIAIQNVRLFEDVQHWAEELERRVEERTDALGQANQRLLEADRVKSQFLANMSHELRTPMNAVIGYTELLLEGTYGPLTTQQQDRLQKVVRNAKSLLQLINDILDISKIEAGRLTLNLSPANLGDVITASLQTVEPLAREKHLHLDVEVDRNLPRVVLDETRIKQVLDNLLANAVKFTEHGNVAIRALCWQEGDRRSPITWPGAPPSGAWALVGVSDTGIGIAREDLSKIFEAFRQADNSTTRRYGGTGLGLAIARELVEMHGGSIWAESVVGNGSTFYFTLPFKGDGRG
ncbi:MAG: GAF domain-containing protein [Acidobacteriota bacterium]